MTSELSQQTFECFVCKKNGFPGEQIYLKGHTPEGYPVRIDLDKVTPHRHKGVGTKWKESQQQIAAAAAAAPQKQQPKTSEKTTEDTLKAVIEGYSKIIERLDQIMFRLENMGTFDPNDDDGDSIFKDP